MKYIMVEDKGSLYPIIFPDELAHSDVATAIVRMIRHSGLHGSKPPERDIVARTPSAGFLNLTVTSVHGESESLGLSAYPQDRTLINVRDYNAGHPSPLDSSTEKMLMLRTAGALVEKLNAED